MECDDATVSLFGSRSIVRGSTALFDYEQLLWSCWCDELQRGLVAYQRTGPMDRLERGSEESPFTTGGKQQSFFNQAGCGGSAFSFACIVTGSTAFGERLAGALWLRTGVVGNVCSMRAI